MVEIDFITTLNLSLCIIILVLGYLRYKTRKSKVPLYVGIAFGLFGISHMMTLLEIQDMESLLLIIRTLGYLTVIFALLIIGREGKEEINGKSNKKKKQIKTKTK